MAASDLRRVIAAGAIALALLAASTPAIADERAAQAEELFQQGKAAMQRKEFVKACELLSASLKLEDTLGTLLNLAVCHEEVGKVATAWGEFTAVEQRALRAVPPQEERAKFAHEHAGTLKPRLSRVKITLAPNARVDGIEVSIDGVPEPEALWEMGVPVDTGRRKIAATAPGKQPWNGEVKVDDENVTVPFQVPPLEDVPKVVPQKQANMVDLSEAEAVASSRARRATGYIIGGIGVASLLATAGFGYFGLQRSNDAKHTCVNGDCYPGSSRLADEIAAHDQASTFANVANVTAGVALVGIGVGAYLLFTTPAPVKKSAQSIQLQLAPSLSREGGGLAAFGAF